MRFAAITPSIFFQSGRKVVYGQLLKCPAILFITSDPLRASQKKLWTIKVEKDKNYATMDTLNAILVNIKYFNRKTPLGKSSYNLSRRLCAKFEPNRMASFWDRLRSGQILWEVNRTTATRGPYPSGKDLCGKKNSRPPSCYRAHLAYVVEGHASACPRTVGVDVSVGRWCWDCFVQVMLMCVRIKPSAYVKSKWRQNSVLRLVVMCSSIDSVAEKQLWAVVSGLSRVHSHLPREGDGMYSTFSISRMDNTV